MRLQYALYERADGGYRWTWRAAELSDALLDDFVYRISLPTDANSIRPAQLRGGICKFDRIVGDSVKEYVVLYRFFDGGSDAGRPNRIVMLAAWTTPDRISTMPKPYAVTAAFRNKMFEYVSAHSRKVGIGKPPFWASWTEDDELASASAPTIPPKALGDWIDGLIDADHDYYLKIEDNEYLLQEKPSALLARKERDRESAEQQRQARDRMRDREKAVNRKAAEMECERLHAGAIAEKRQKRPQRRYRGVLLPLLLLLAITSLLVLTWLGYISLFGTASDALSPEAAQILRAFEELPPNEQQKLLMQFEKLVRERQLHSMPLFPSPYPGEAPSSSNRSTSHQPDMPSHRSDPMPRY